MQEAKEAARNKRLLEMNQSLNVTLSTLASGENDDSDYEGLQRMNVVRFPLVCAVVSLCFARPIFRARR